MDSIPVSSMMIEVILGKVMEENMKREVLAKKRAIRLAMSSSWTVASYRSSGVSKTIIKDQAVISVSLHDLIILFCGSLECASFKDLTQS